MKSGKFLWRLLGSAVAFTLVFAGCAAGQGDAQDFQGGQSGDMGMMQPPYEPSGESSAGGGAQYHKLTAEEAKARMDEGEAVVVDVRTQAEYDAGHIEGAVLLPNETILEDQPGELPELDAVILVYCRSGRRSREAAEKLVAMGYTQVYDFGGVQDWPYGVVKD